MVNTQSSSSVDDIIIQATPDDYPQLADFLNQNNFTHRHLDWFSPLDWLGKQPFLIKVVENQIQSLLCAASENPQAAWVRVFAIKKHLNLDRVWQDLLRKAIETLKEKGIKQLASLALSPWYKNLLSNSKFDHLQDVVVLEWQQQLPNDINYCPEVTVRPMQAQDLPQVAQLDQLSFSPLWQNSQAGLSNAFNQSGISTVAEIDEKIIGYQISNTMNIYGHLARLAVHPEYQQQNIASTLLYDLLTQFKQHNYLRVTVNTQSDNIPSLRLYEKFGFIRTDEEIPVYAMAIE